MQFPLEAQRKVARGKNGRWVYCLAEQNYRRWGDKFLLVEVTEIVNEASATIYFKKYLEAGNYFLVKMPELIAQQMKTFTASVAKL